MINLQISSRLVSPAQPQLVRLGMRAFWVFIVLQAVVLGAIALLMITTTPTGLALSRTQDIERVRSFILASDSARDPLIEVTPTVIGRSSSVRGVQLGGQTYFYYYEGLTAYDPLSRGLLREDQIERVLRDDGSDAPLVVYRLLR